MKKILLILIPILIIIAVVAYKASLMQTTQPEGAYLFSGTAEVTDVRLSFKIPGRIQKINYDEGDTIKKGATVAALQDTDEKLAVDAAQANLVYNQANLAEVMAGSRKQEIRNARAAVDIANAAVKKAKAELQQAKHDNDRFLKLYQQKGVSERTYELYKTAYEAALHTYQEALGSKIKAKENLSLAIEGARSQAIEKAKALVGISEQSLRQAEQKLDYTVLKSPMDCVVLTRTAEEGEFVQTGSTILTVANLKKLWIRGYVSEQYLGKIKLGQKVIITSDSYPGKKYTGKITYISDEAEFTPKTVETYDQRINYMYRIKVTVDNSDMEFKDGMPVTGRIELGSK